MKGDSALDFEVNTLDHHHAFEGPAKIYVRQCYMDLVDEFFVEDAAAQEGGASKRPRVAERRRVVIGNPGIGKSIARLVVAQRALWAGKNVAFVKAGEDGDKLVYFVGRSDDRDCVFRSLKDLSVSPLIKSCVVLIDSSDGSMPTVEEARVGDCWYFTSPSSSISVDKMKDGFLFLWILLWTLAELLRAAELLNLALTHSTKQLIPGPLAAYVAEALGQNPQREDVVRMRCYQFGGVARIVLATSEETILAHIDRMSTALLSVNAGDPVVIRSLFDANGMAAFKSAHTLVGIRTTYRSTADRKAWFSRATDTDAPVAEGTEVAGVGFLQAPVDWLSRPIRELAFGGLAAAMTDFNNVMTSFLSTFPSSVAGAYQERFFVQLVATVSTNQDSDAHLREGAPHPQAAGRGRHPRPQHDRWRSSAAVPEQGEAAVPGWVPQHGKRALQGSH